VKILETDAFIVVDVQNDFLPGGSLAVNDGRLVVPVINNLVPLFKTKVFTRDWHPAGHMSFDAKPEFVDKSWPDHCVQNTRGAEFYKDLNVPDDALIISKGADPDVEAYSGFQGTDLSDQLVKKGVKRVFIAGLATDYCVKFTALDSIKSGLPAFVIEDGIRGVDVPEGTAQTAIDDMKKAGAVFVTSKDII
jgi:nicotinamidase/pyrazinamidase